MANDIHLWVREGREGAVMILFLLAGIIILIIVVFFIGLTLRDIQTVRLERQYRAHPYARTWRRRPLLSVYGTLPYTFVRAIRRDYRKIEILDKEQIPKGELILIANREVTFDKKTLSLAVRQFNARPELSALELIPLLPEPTTLRQFLDLYRILLASILMKSRAGLGIPSTHSLFPTLIKKTARPTRYMHFWHNLYQAMNCFVAVGLPIALSYALYVALVLHQPELLFVCLGGFSMFLVSAIWSYEYLLLARKLKYTLLLPATLGYFFALAWIRPLKMLTDMTKAKFPIGIGLFVRVKDVLRIV